MQSKFAILPSSNINAIISRVTFPILSNIQDDNVRLASAYRKYIKLASYLIFPLMVGLAAVAQPLVLLLLTEKWMMAAVLLQILCFDWMFDHLSIINLNLLYVKGRSDWALRMEIIKKIYSNSYTFCLYSFRNRRNVLGTCFILIDCCLFEFLLYKVTDRAELYGAG